MKGFAKGTVVGFAILVVGIQFIRPARTNPAVVESRTLQSAVSVSPAVQEVITRSCGDCHSNLTRWPWYTNVAPISWFVINHVADGRRHMNFSEWLRPAVKDPVQYTRQKFHSACREVQTGDMPLSSYLLLHPSARLSPGDVKTICDWADKGLPQQ